jgi:hypothetical protein
MTRISQGPGRKVPPGIERIGALSAIYHRQTRKKRALPAFHGQRGFAHTGGRAIPGDAIE